MSLIELTGARFRPGAFDVDSFVREYWQQKPLLIRNPWEAWANPIVPDDLAGLACEDDVETRLIVRSRNTHKAEFGPFAETRFDRLKKKPYTLLVQAVDHFVPEVAALIEPFRFVPNWRIDDVMVSFATDGGGVGPHFDQYDVFLIQGLGRRRWQLGGLCDASTPLARHDDLQLLADFAATDEWVLDPGDILYVPPRIAHNGVAVGDGCMTYSIGFRAPSRRELISDWCDHLAGALPDDDRFRDESLDPRANPGEIDAKAITRLHDMVTEALLDRDAFARWFGQHSSTRKYPEIDWSPDEPIGPAELRYRLAADARLRRNPASRYAFIRQSPGSLLLFVDGETFACSGDAMALAERLCSNDAVTLEPAMRSDSVIALVVGLLNQGSLALADED